MPRHPNSAGITLTGSRPRKQKERPPDQWAYPPDTPIPHPPVEMGMHPRLVNGEWIWPQPDHDYEQQPNAWRDWQEGAEDV